MKSPHKKLEKGNIFFLLFAAVGMAGLVALSIQSFVMAPLTTATKMTKKNSAETQMQLGVRVAATNAVSEQPTSGDCDGDGMVEPLPYVAAGANPRPTGGGLLPATMGGNRIDPWGTQFGYCVWDHGSAINAAGCGGGAQLRLAGTNAQQWDSMAIISAGADKVFQTSCNAWVDTTPADSMPDTPLVNKPVTSDDVFYSWSYQEASAGTGGLWTLETADPNTAEVARNLSIRDGSNVERLSFNAATRSLALGTGGRGDFPTIRADAISALTSPSIQLMDALWLNPEDGSGRSLKIINESGDTFRLRTPFDPAAGWGEYGVIELERWGGGGVVAFFAASNFWTFFDGQDEKAMNFYNLLTLSGPSGGLNTGLSMTSLRTGGVGSTNLRLRGRHTPTGLSTPFDTSYIAMKDMGGVANPSLLSGGMSFHTRPSGTAAGATTLPERMTINATGDVGIGQPLPTARLHVTGGNTFLATAGGHTLGIGLTTTPVVKMEVNGAIRVGSTVTACSGTIEGSMRYNTAARCMELCDGTSWSCLQGAQCATNTPAAFTFTDVMGATASTSYRSNIVQITGLGTCSVMIDEMNATAEFRICTNGTTEPNCDASVVQGWTMGTGTGSAGTVTNNQYVQLRMTSRPNGNLTRTAQLSVGGRTVNWNVTPTGLCTDPTPPSGTMCADGTMYVGMSPDGGTKMYTTPCPEGENFNPTTYTCASNSLYLRWSVNNTVNTGISSAITGETNTTTLAGLSNADSAYQAPIYCQNLSRFGSSDWYLPARNEAALFRSNCSRFATTCANGDWTWTSTQGSTAASYVFSLSGYDYFEDKRDQRKVWCVRKD